MNKRKSSVLRHALFAGIAAFAAAPLFGRPTAPCGVTINQIDTSWLANQEQWNFHFDRLRTAGDRAFFRAFRTPLG
jgi:hypothetical protein